MRAEFGWELGTRVQVVPFQCTISGSSILNVLLYHPAAQASPPETALTLLRLLAVALGLGLAVAGDRAAVAPVVTIASIAATIAPGANAAYLRKLPIDIIHASLGFLRGHLPRNTHG